MLNYCITSNHTHLLLKVGYPARISTFMRHLEGEFASSYNRRKCRRGAFWSERYHATLIEDGCYFWNCMHYIDLNMVRARSSGLLSINSGQCCFCHLIHGLKSKKEPIFLALTP
jgi:REP element-mobilizing transposase RayT